jgi:hypothetical protein
MRFARLDRRNLVADFGGGAITSDAGALLLGATDRAINLVDRFAGCFTDGRTPGRVVHEVHTLVGQRVFAVALGYEDLSDHDDLRSDPVLGPVLGRLEARRPGCVPLAGKSTLNRLEHAPVDGDRYRKIAHEPDAIEHLFVDLFLAAHATPPARIILDLDATDDPIHGRQEGRFFHGYYDGYCYLPLYEDLYCARVEMENRIKECQLDLLALRAAFGSADRTSAATMKANQLRLWFAWRPWGRRVPVRWLTSCSPRCAGSRSRTLTWRRRPAARCGSSS